MELFPDLGTLSDEELKQLKDELEAQEQELSYQRRMLHGKIDILRAELVARLQRSGGRSVLDELDVDRLTEILTGKAARTPGAMSHVYCTRMWVPEPGGGELLLALRRAAREGRRASETTQAFSAEEVGEHAHDPLEGLDGPGARRPLRRRAGRGRASCPPASARASAARPTATSSSTT